MHPLSFLNSHCSSPGAHLVPIFLLVLVFFLNSCGCSKTPPLVSFFHPLNGTEHGSPPFLTTCDRELVSVLEVSIESEDLNLRPPTLQSITLPTLPQAGSNANSFYNSDGIYCHHNKNISLRIHKRKAKVYFEIRLSIQVHIAKQIGK